MQSAQIKNKEVVKKDYFSVVFIKIENKKDGDPEQLVVVPTSWINESDEVKCTRYPFDEEKKQVLKTFLKYPIINVN